MAWLKIDDMMKHVTPTKKDKGAAALEFALILPLLLMLMMGIVEFGRAYNIVVSLQGAAREGARELALQKTASEVQTAVKSSSGLNPASLSISTTACPTPPAGARARVVVSRNFQFGIPFIPLGTVTLKGDASMRCGL